MPDHKTFMPFESHSILFNLSAQPVSVRYGLAFLAVTVTTIATIYIPVIGERAAFLLFFFGIIQISFWLGLYPGVLAAGLSLIAVNALVLLPAGTEPYDILTLNAGFCFVSIVMVATTYFHRRVAKALWESQQDLDYAQTVGQIGSWRLNVSCNELIWSNENHRIFGIPIGTPMNYEKFLSIVHPDDRECVDRLWQSGLKGEPYDIEHRLVVDGQVKWVREKAVLEFDKKGSLLGGFGITQDITELKRNEKALLESRRRYSGVFESAMDAIVTIDNHQRIILFNAAAERMFGCKADDAIGVSFDHFIPEWSCSYGSKTTGFCSSGSPDTQGGGRFAINGLRVNGEAFSIEASVSQCDVEGESTFTVILRDVTEVMRAEFALKERIELQDQLTKVAASVPGLICSFRLRPDGSVSMPYASPSSESLYGFSPEALADDFSPVFALIHPDDIEHIRATIAESARTQHPWRDTWRYQHPAKGEVWHEGYSMPLREMDGSILWHGYVQDVTERIQAENELQERIERYELVLAGAQDAIWDWDVINKRVHYSSRWKALRGFSEADDCNDESLWSTNIHPDDLTRIMAAVQAHFDGKTPVFCEEYRIRCKDGSWKWVLDRGLAKKNSSGKVLRMAGSESDITARKLAEAALLERENELRLIMDATPALISYINTDFRYLRVNATYENWFNITADQIVGKKAQDIIGKEAWRIVQPYLERTRAGDTVNFDQQIPYGNGKPRWVHATYIPYKDSSGKVKGIVVHIVDITDRKEAENKIATLNQNLLNRIEEMEVIFNTVPIGLAITNDVNGYHIRGNPASERMFGLPEGADLSKHSASMAAVCIMQNERELTINELPMQRAGRGELVTNLVMDIIRPDGQWIKILSNASPLFNENGKPRGAVGAFLDITALKKAEESLEKSQLQLRLFVEQAPLSIAMLDRDMNYLVTSHRWIEEFGRGYEELTGRNHYAVNLDIPAEWKEVYRRALAGEFLRSEDDLWIRADGSQHWSRWAVYPWTNPAGEIGGIMISSEDITARRQAEQELRNSEARLALVVDQVKAGYWDWDLLTQKLFLSPESKRQLGFEDSELLDRREEWIHRLHPEDRTFVLGIMEKCLSGLQSNYELEFRLRHRDNSYRWIHSRGVLLNDQNNQAYRMLGINLDITDYMKQRELSERRDKMEKAFRQHVAVQTAAAIAHELNQPLTAISSYADVALHTLQTGEPNLQKLALLMQNCSQQAQRAGKVIRQLLTLLQKGEIVSEPMDINASVHEAIDLMNADGLLNDFNIELDLAADLPLVNANALQIQKVLINLLRNGLESLQEQDLNAGKINVTTRVYEDDQSMLLITVCDNGTGVPDAAALRKIFQPFHSTKPAGLGVGLAISRSLIAAHGGKMWAEQNAGNGLSIHFTLPRVI
ncbi:PAS domain S-box protein [Methylicorpusculum oleiharenae]|uniref:PAS domain S-box protein n=1 Tax=Methylicorpusculum oleiharenae TaxID=1338687 RepID=UPI00135AD3FF|nr:PAS domain S-box protein [Methylicorpusculum oleiharenae]MCD2450223.1 PAS domain S-box protein [Methylicorpusculum oleiharenae]